MAYVNVFPLHWPRFPGSVSRIGFGQLLIDASGEKAGFTIRVPKTGTLNKVGFFTHTVVQAQTIRVSFQDLDANGFPDETQDQYRDVSIADTDDSVWKETGIISSDGTDTGTKRSVTKGQFLAVAFEHPSFAAGDVFRVQMFNGSTIIPANEYVSLKTGGSWAKQANAIPNMALLYDDGLVYPMSDCPPFTAAGSQSFNVDTTAGSGGDERGNKFQVPFACKVQGMWAALLDTSGDFDLVLYDSDGTSVLESVSIDKDYKPLASDAFIWAGYFDTEITLTPGTNYYAMIKPTTTTNVSAYRASVNTAAYLDQILGGQNVHAAIKTDGGSPTPTTTQRYNCGIIISALSDTATGGGILIHPGMSGGMGA